LWTPFLVINGQIKPKADWRTVDSPKKGTNEFVFVASKSKKQKKNHFLRESTAANLLTVLSDL
jgi:hypothetical protein